MDITIYNPTSSNIIKAKITNFKSTYTGNGCIIVTRASFKMDPANRLDITVAIAFNSTSSPAILDYLWII